jgi:hypothetical protein
MEAEAYQEIAASLIANTETRHVTRYRGQFENADTNFQFHKSVLVDMSELEYVNGRSSGLGVEAEVVYRFYVLFHEYGQDHDTEHGASQNQNESLDDWRYFDEVRDHLNGLDGVNFKRITIERKTEPQNTDACFEGRGRICRV